MDFSVFDWPYRITAFILTPGYRDQNTSDWVPESEGEMDIQGSFDMRLLDGDRHTDEGITVSGGATLFTEHAFKKGDRVRIYDNQAGTMWREFRVNEVAHNFSWIHSLTSTNNRSQYSLELEEPDR